MSLELLPHTSEIATVSATLWKLWPHALKVVVVLLGFCPLIGFLFQVELLMSLVPLSQVTGLS